MRPLLPLLPLLALLACAPDPAPIPAELAEDEVSEPVLVPLDPPRLLRRMSLDLQGRLPEPEELHRVAADPEAWTEIVAAWMAGPEFEERMVELLAERWWTRIDVYDVVYQDYGLGPQDEFAFEENVGEEPLRLIARSMAEDRPWGEVVLADHTLATPLLTRLWPLEFTGDVPAEGEWAEARYTDGRPAAGVLATNGLWWRYSTNESNMNRGRAAAISRLLLCEDVLARPISFTAADTDVANPEEAIRTDPACQACHASLDPVAASLFGFWWLTLYSRIEEDRYHPEREALAEEIMGQAPAWYGEEITGLSDLGVHIARDSRTYACAVEGFASLLWRRPTTPDDQPRLEAARVAFLQAEARPQALLMALLASPEYQAGAVAEGARGSVEARERTARMLSPAQLDGIGRGLVNLQWRRHGFDQLRNDAIGYRVLAGGVDGSMLTQAQADPGLTWVLVTQRWAQAVASLAVKYELEERSEAVILAGATPEIKPGEAEFDRALGSIWWRLTATELPEAERAAYSELWLAVEAESGGDVFQAWRSTLTMMLRDPAFLSY